MPISPLPHTYTIELVTDHVTAEPRPPIFVGAPPEFGGTADRWSPEHLLLAATLSCLKTTFDAYVRRERITIHDWHGVGTAVLAKGPSGPMFSSIDLRIEIVTDAGDEVRTESVLATAELNCIVARALALPVTVHGKVTSLPARAAG